MLFCVFLPLAVSVMAWCRRRNVGVLTWMLRIMPIVVVFLYPDSLSASWVGGFCFMALLKKSVSLAVVALISLVSICVLIVRWPGWTVKMPRNKGLRILFRCVYSVCSFVLALVITIAVTGAFSGVIMACEYRTIDCSYATRSEMTVGSRRAASFAKWLPPAATDIRYFSEAKFGGCTERVTCRCEEAELIRFAEERSYPLATNSFIKLDYYIPEQDDRFVYEQMARDAETQHQLVFGDRPLPENYISLTRSHAFGRSGGGGSYRVIFVFDRDAKELTGYHKESLL